MKNAGSGGKDHIVPEERSPRSTMTNYEVRESHPAAVAGMHHKF